jgi:hypothetical protein
MNNLCLDNWYNVLNPERLEMEIVKAFETYISDNAMQGINFSSLKAISRKCLAQKKVL